MFERKHERLLPLRQFIQRVVRFAVIAGVMLALALGLGVAGYHWIADERLVDALLDASMILTGMGPVGELKSTAAKLFASAYALFSGIVFITAVGVFLSPLIHRFLHHFHLDEPAD
jgi:hypothetical protein